MKVQSTSIVGCYEIEPKVFEDHRGYFVETFNEQTLKQYIPELPIFVQDNEAFSKEVGVIRGLHGQKGSAAQAKLVRVVKGKVIDVALDIRKESPSFGKFVAVELSGENKKQLLVPRGCLHGYIVLEKDTLFTYKCDNFYNKSAEIGLNVKDLSIGIDWKLPIDQWILSEKDELLPDFQTLMQQL